MAAQSSEAIDIIIKAKDQAGKTFKNLNRELQKTETGVKKVGIAYGKLKGRLFNLKTALTGAFVGLGLSALAKGAIQTAAEFEQLEKKLNALTKGRGKETLDELNEWALTMPINTKGAIQAFSTMLAYGLNPTIEKMESLVNVSTIFGEAAVPRISRALGQMAALGKISAEELNQLSEVGINARKYLYEAFGKSVEDLQSSSIAIEEIIEAIWQGFDADYSGAAKKAQNSWNGLMTTLESYWTEFQKQVMGSEVFDFLKAGIRSIVDEITIMKASGDFSKWAAEVADRVLQAFGLIAQGVALLKKSFESLDFLYNAFSSLGLRAQLKLKENQLKDTENIIEGLMTDEERIKKRIAALKKEGTRVMDEGEVNKAIDYNERILVSINQQIEGRERYLDTQVQENNLLAEEINLHDKVAKEISQGISPFKKMEGRVLDLRLAAKDLGKAAKDQVDGMKELLIYSDAMKKAGFQKPPKVKVPQASELAKTRSLFSQVANDIELELAKIESLYENSGLSLTDYFDKREQQLKRGYDVEVKYLAQQKEALAPKDMDKRLAVEDKIQKRRVQYAIDQKKLDDERVKAERDLAKVRESIDTGILEKRIELEEQNVTDMERVLDLKLELMKRKQKEETDDLITNLASPKRLREKFALDEIEQAQFVADEKKKIAKQQADYERDLQQRRLSVYQDSGNLQQIFQLETDLLARKHAAEIAAIEGHEKYIGQLKDTYRVQELERDKLAADQKLELQRKLFGEIGNVLSDMNSAFGDLYDASGQKVKAYFQIQKAVSIAQTIIKTYQAAQDAYSGMVMAIPGPYGIAAGIAAAAVSTAAGLARVAAIRAQSYAVGGEVKGYSPHRKADNIKANVTAGEYILPVDAVDSLKKRYGIGIMEGLRRGMIRNMGFGIPRLQYASSYAEGGPVAAGATGMGINTNISVNVNSSGGEDSRALGKDVSKAVKIEFNKNLQEQMRVGGLLYARR